MLGVVEDIVKKSLPKINAFKGRIQGEPASKRDSGSGYEIECQSMTCAVTVLSLTDKLFKVLP